MQDQMIISLFAESTVKVLIFGILIGSLFSIAVLAIFDAIKACNAKCKAEEAKKKAVATNATTVKKAPAKKPAAKKAPVKKATTAKKAPAKKPAAKKKK